MHWYSTTDFSCRFDENRPKQLVQKRYLILDLSRTLTNLHFPAEDRTGNRSIQALAFYQVLIISGLYRKAVQVYAIPNQYPVT